MILYCHKDHSCYQVAAEVCIFYCENSIKTRCVTYYQNYEILKELPIEPRYIDKYGQPDFPMPKALIAAKKKADKAAKQAAKEEAKKGKRKRRTKEEMAEATKVIEKVAAKKVKKVVAAEPEVKPKRKRRTKAEMAEARAKGEK